MSERDRPIVEHLLSGREILSVEFSPPRTEDAGAQLLKTARLLGDRIGPDFVSITYGAGGSTRARTEEYARILRSDYGFDVVAHLTCVGSTKTELREILREYRGAGLRNIMALRGDPPRGQAEFRAPEGGCAFANELVELIRENEPDFCIGVAGYPEKHPQAPSLDEDIANLRRKVDAGASYVTTQLFYDNRFYYEFVSKCRAAGIFVPILPGLMTPLGHDQVLRFGKMNGSSVPAELENRLAAALPDEAAQRRIGIEWTIAQARDLFQHGVKHLHLYVMNRSESALELVDCLEKEGVLASRGR
ncbi:MAG TPA: methylenetetrahydrofolate reductase [NAD(P)H] [Opitutales bacterium]|nr:methylenetetrahydrofolate reductase [NAD(P)H] [Opitutales bacterium]